MKDKAKILFYVLGILIGIILILIGLWFYFRIYVVVGTKEGITYDGFGYEYVYQKPSNPYTICIYIFAILGIDIIAFCRKKLLELRDENNKNQN